MRVLLGKFQAHCFDCVVAGIICIERVAEDAVTLFPGRKVFGGSEGVQLEVVINAMGFFYGWYVTWVEWP